MTITRPATSADLHAIEDALIAAFDWRGSGGFSRSDLSAPEVAKYVAGWRRESDVGVVAVDDSGATVGAAWLRLFGANDAGYGFVAPDIPELSMGVTADARGRGVGRQLLTALLEAARTAGLAGASLSVEDGNDVARRLYEGAGFVVVSRVGDSDTMLKTI